MGGPKNDHLKLFALAFESMAPAGAIDSNETGSIIPANSRPMVKYILPMVKYILPMVKYFLPLVKHILPRVKYFLPLVKYILPLVEYILPLVKYNSNQSNPKGEVVFRPNRGSKLQTWLFLACEAS